MFLVLPKYKPISIWVSFYVSQICLTIELAAMLEKKTLSMESHGNGIQRCTDFGEHCSGYWVHTSPGLDSFFILPPAINFNAGNIYAKNPQVLDPGSVGLRCSLAGAQPAHPLERRAYCCSVHKTSCSFLTALALLFIIPLH